MPVTRLKVNVHQTSLDVTNKDQIISLNVYDNTSWSEVSKLLKKKLNVSGTNPLAFQYLDDEDDYITGCTDEEWCNAVTVGSRKSRNELVIDITALTTENVVLQREQEQHQGSSCCSPGISWSKNKSSSPCCFQRPIPETPIFDDVIPEKTCNPDSSTYQYSGEALRAVALPLGPIGGGSIAIAGDGGLRQWQVVNRVSHTAHVPNSFFAIKVQEDSGTSQVVLQSDALYDESKFKPAAYVTDHVVPPASKTLLKELPGVNEIKVTAKYPTAEVDVLSDEIPVKVHLEAFNPCIPLNSKDSAIPIVIFNYTVHNPSTKSLKVTMLSSLMNFVSWDGKTVITCDDAPGFSGGNQNTLYTYQGNVNGGNVPQYQDLSGYYGIYMNNPSMNSQTISNGELSIGVLTKTTDINACYLQFTDVKEMWQYFTSSSGLPGQGHAGVSQEEKSWCGAISCMREIPANTSEIFSFVLSWHFPHRFSNWPQQVKTNPNSLYYLGNQYKTFWKDNQEVLQYTTQNIGRLTQSTRDFRDAMFNSTLPWQLIDSAAGRVSVVRSPSFMWLEDSNLYCFEGCSPDAGCCPLNCTHVLNYEMVVAKCFPDLERSMRNIDLMHNISPNYIIPSRTSVPLELKAQWESWNWSSPDDPVNLASTSICLDGDLGTVLKAYREIRQGAPAEFLENIWPKIKLMMQRYMNKLDNGNGVIPGPQPCTYDEAMYGVNTFIGCLYLCALRAAEKMAYLMHDDATAELYYARFIKGSKYLDEACFLNGKWFTQVVPQSHPVQVLGNGTFVDALIGQWWAHSLGLGYLLPQAHIQSHLKYVTQRNFIDSFDPSTQSPRKFFDQRDSGLVITSWEGVKTPENPLRYSFEGAWSGLMHSFAGLCFYENLLDIGLKVTSATRAQYDGTRRSPWNEIECGDHYTRAMAAFLFFEIASGMTWDIVDIGKKTLKLNFAPVINPEDFKGFFIVGSGWGSFSQAFDSSSANIELEVLYGEVAMLQLGLVSNFTVAKVTLDGNEIHTTVTKDDGKVILNFGDTPLNVTNGQLLKILMK